MTTRHPLDGLDEEIRDHIERETAELIARGIPPAEASRQARVKFGNVGLAREDTRAVWVWTWLDQLRQDVRYALRTLGRTRGLAVVLILTLALGIGAHTAIFSVVRGVLLKPLPYADPDRLVLIQAERDVVGSSRPLRMSFSLAELAEWHTGTSSFESIGFYASSVAALATDTGAEVVDGAIVSEAFFATMKGRMAIGRGLGTTDDAMPSVVISDRLWRRAYGASPDVIGRSIILSSQPYTIVGVADSTFQFPSAGTDFWMPAAFYRTVNPRCCSLQPVARLKPGVSVEQARADIGALMQAMGSTNPSTYTDARASVAGLHDELVSEVRNTLVMLFGAIALVLLVACVNAATLLLVRHVARAREQAVRLALGASPRRLFLQSVVVGALLSTTGGVLGLGIAAGTVAGLASLGPIGVPRLEAVRLDMTVLLFAVGLAALTTLIVSVVPALQAATLVNDLKVGWRNVAASPGARRLRRALIVAELAVSVVLLVGTGLFGRSLVGLLQTDLGVTTDHVATASINLAFGRTLTDAQQVALMNQLVERVRAIPGVTAAGVGTSLPPNASRMSLTLRRTGETVDYRATAVPSTPGYFPALGIRLVEGRLFTDWDTDDQPPVMIMSAATARRFFGGGQALGQTMSLPALRNGETARLDMTLIGIVDNVRYSGLAAAPDDTVYRPFAQQPWSSAFLVARTEADAADLAARLRREIAAVDPAISVGAVATLASVVSDEAAQPWFRAILLGALAGLALVIAVIGLYAVVAYSVSQRTGEFGVRMALGAQRTDILNLVFREGLQLAVAGIVLGLAGAWALTHLVAGLLYGVAPTDPVSFAVAGGFLLLVAATATCAPAYRASRLDASLAIRTE